MSISRMKMLQVSKCLIGLAVMVLQSCDVAENRRDLLCGNWESVEGKPDVLIYKEGEAYKVTVFKRSGIRRKLKPETYLLQEENGNLYMNKFDQIQALLGLTEKEKSQILSINMANNPSRFYKEVWIGLGGTQSAVYATEVSAEEYLAYTTEETEKVEVYRLAEQLGGDIEAAIRQLAERRRNKE